MQKQRYLFQRGSLFYFRIALPLDIKFRLQKNEVKLALGTSYLRAAHFKAQRLTIKVEHFIRQLRSTDMQELTPGQLRDILDDYLKDMLEESELHRALGRVLTRDELGEEDELLRDFEGDYKEELACKDYRRSSKWADELIADRGLKLDKKGESYKILCRELLKTAITCLQIEQERTYGNYSSTALSLNTGPAHNQRGGNDKEGLSRAKLSEVVQCYVGEYDSSKGWTSKTKAENVAIYDLLIRIVGDIQVCYLNHATLRHFKNTLLRLPPNINKLACYKGKTLEEIISIPNLKTLSIATINKYLIRASSLFSWASQHGYILKNYAAGLTLANNKRHDMQREIFSQSDLKTFFSTPEYTNQTFKHPYQYWLPILALYLGCRIEELCQLHLNDLIQVDDVWVVSINAGSSDKKLKTKSALRQIPLHPKLLELGLLEYVDTLKAAKVIRLFPELERSRDGYSQTPSKYFGRYLERYSLGHVTFHSFRHTFSTALKYAGVEEHKAAELLGHEVPGMSYGRYGKRFKPSAMLEVIQKLDYGIEFSRYLRGSICVE